MRTNMGVLGPLVLDRAGRSRVPSAPKPRQLLALLMIHANQMVRASDCLVELWDTQPPKSAMSTLQTYVLHLRRAFEEDDEDGAPGPELRTMNQGYQLCVPRRELDQFAFQDLTRQGGDAARAGDHRRASALFGQALRLWRGPALADVRPGPLSLPPLVELEETRKYVLERRIEADLRLGRHHQLLTELDRLTRAAPTHENLHGQYMLALYRAGQQNRALTVYRRLSRTLEEDLGFEPGTRIQRLHRAVAAGHPALGAPSRP
ncbi:MAG TPA: AfsR/SARP family transcriptional regulator [Actinophytocola sp.]|uniref:AfsR/SARP family transcriptional regulator n=1 Tax=Actinophytocola sp. TaxID=1872138 RepID=UPI002DB8CA65|nr:AfsR/SARP family transcriptional regulator [Actinophytocola sp.]HEU5473532.1 AfsR/SARP family transcriptional regulator [Actinophytocola sp.]